MWVAILRMQVGGEEPVELARTEEFDRTTQAKEIATQFITELTATDVDYNEIWLWDQVSDSLMLSAPLDCYA